MLSTRQFYSLLLSNLYIVAALAASRKGRNLSNLEYSTYPLRKSEEAAVVEWGHSAVISALEGAVAAFGPQTSRGAFFEVETGIVLSKPIDGNTDNEKLDNAGEIEGNMLVMTNAAKLSGVKMAKLAQSSGAAALMVVNVLNPDTPDLVYSLQPEDESEAAFAEENIDIPVIMVSLASGNVLTSAQDPQINNGMPERVRLYAGGDRPFFEDASSAEPMVYLIHNLLTEAECDSLIEMAKGKMEKVDDAIANFLEGTDASTKTFGKVTGVDRAFLWKGGFKGQEGKGIDERMEQVTGYPVDHMSDFQVNQYSGDKAMLGPHYDELRDSSMKQMASITIFLNDVEEGFGGEIVFPSANPPVKILPKKGMAVVHHNLNEHNEVDPSTVHAELAFNPKDPSAVKWTAKRWVYVDALSPTRRFVLPILAAPFGGKLPSIVKSLHMKFLEKFGLDTGELYFDKFSIMLPMALLLAVVSLINNLVNPPSKSAKKGGKDKKTKKSKKTQ